MLAQLLHTFIDTLDDVAPIVAMVVVFQFMVIRRPVANPGRVLAGFVYVLLGLTLFLVGLEKALFPLGRLMAEQLTHADFLYGTGQGAPPAIHWADYLWVYVFGFAIGFSTTIAEPSLLAVAIKAHQVSGGTIGIWGLRRRVAPLTTS